MACEKTGTQEVNNPRALQAVIWQTEQEVLLHAAADRMTEKAEAAKGREAHGERHEDEGQRRERT